MLAINQQIKTFIVQREHNPRVFATRTVERESGYIKFAKGDNLKKTKTKTRWLPGWLS